MLLLNIVQNLRIGFRTGTQIGGGRRHMTLPPYGNNIPLKSGDPFGKSANLSYPKHHGQVENFSVAVRNFNGA